MSRTGWAKRALDPSELEMCFELPDFVRWNPQYANSIVPLQLFRVVIDNVLDQMDPPVGSGAAVRQKLGVIEVEAEEDPEESGVWLPSIHRWLPGSWTDVDISARAVKADDSQVDFRPWHLRISLVLPCSVRHLMVFERFAMRRWRANVINSFFVYLSCRYGTLWSKRLMALGLSGLNQESPDGCATAAVPSFPINDGGGEVGKCRIICGAWESHDQKVKDFFKDIKRGLTVIGQVLKSTWWEWSSGSSLFFWRWNGETQIKAARDGMFVQSALPRRDKAKNIKFSDETRPMVAKKLQGMIHKGYLEFGRVRTSLHYFAVAKGETDIRVVYDGTSCGLNEALWSPNFFLPTARSAGLLLTFGSWMADMDFGEFFHNFPMTEKICQHAGVNVKALAPFVVLDRSSAHEGLDLRWSRLFMGMKPSPYNSVRHYYWGEEFARGNPATRNNPFGYDEVRLNLPGMESYDPTSPKIMKWNSEKGSMAGDVIAFIDDVRMTGPSKEGCHLVHRQFTSRMQYLGFQDAPRKFRPPSQTNAGAWTGTIFCVGRTAITKTVSQEKWNKGRTLVEEFRNLCEKAGENGRPLLNRKALERSTGFLNHLATTFEEITPYLKGFYLSLNSWRVRRNSQDWKVTDKVWVQLLMCQLEKGLISADEFDASIEGDTGDAPASVVASPRFADDVRALSHLFSSVAPPRVGLRSKNIVTVVYGFGDASGTGLGATFTCGSGFNFRIGVWGSEGSEESSNWREFTNIVESLEEEAELGQLDNSEVFMFTDNSTVESCVAKGSSTSLKLFELVVRLRCLTTTRGVKLHIFHVSGTRMIAQGTDGVSRGFLGAGIMAGDAMTSFIPIHLAPCERSIQLVPWVISWTVGAAAELVHLTPMQWFEDGHDILGWSKGWDGFDRPIITQGRVYLWTPPPFAADVALVELRKARIKRQESSHIFICPRLCTGLWIRQLYKAADIVLEIPAGKSFWNKEMHEPLLIGILFPFIRCKPWQLRSTPKMFAVAREVRGSDICQRMWCGECYSSADDLMFHVADPENLRSEDGDENRLVTGWKLKGIDKRRFCVARDGDDLLVSFECDICIFAKIYSRLPDSGVDNDKFVLGCIRRANLDAFWSRARSTVTSNTVRFREMVNMSNRLGFEPPYSDPGPLPGYDHCGYRVAVLMLTKSLKSGRYSDTHSQWDTIRKFRSTFSNQIRASRVSNSTTMTLADNKGLGYQRLTTDPCGSLWFNRFMTGCQKRMGQDWRPNRAISIQLVNRLLILTESRIMDAAGNSGERDKWIMAGSYFCFCFVLSLRSPEGLMVDLAGLIEFNSDHNGRPFVVIPLLGQVKGEDHTRQHLLHCVNTTDSGISVCSWVNRLLGIHRLKQRTVGPAFLNEFDIQSSTAEMNDLMIELLGEIYEDNRDLFAVDIKSALDVADKYNVFRSFRRGSESRAVAKKVSEADRYVVNRWRKKEVAGTAKVSHPIDQHYVDVSIVKDSFLRYTKAM